MKFELVLMAVLIICIGFCEVLWWLLKTESRSPSYVQFLTKFLMILNVCIALIIGSWGNLVFAVVISFYYFVLIPYRLRKQ